MVWFPGSMPKWKFYKCPKCGAEAFLIVTKGKPKCFECGTEMEEDTANLLKK